MPTHEVTVFRPYPLQIGQKIRIEGGPRGGDWTVIGISESRVTLRCPVSDHEVKWDRFCYFVEEAKYVEWPERD